MRHVQEMGVTQCTVRHHVLAISTFDGDTPDSHGRQLIIQPGRIFRSLSPSSLPSVASTVHRLRPLWNPWGRWVQALGHIMTAVTDPQIAKDRHNNVSIGAQNGNVAPNILIVLPSDMPCVEFSTLEIESSESGYLTSSQHHQNLIYVL